MIAFGFTQGELGMAGDGKDEIDMDNLGGALDSYLDGNIRQIVLYFKKEEYESVLPRLQAIMESSGLESHTEVFLKLIKHYEDTGTSQ